MNRYFPVLHLGTLPAFTALNVPPFAVQSAPAVDAATWDAVVVNVTPPVTFPAPGPTQFYRVTGR